MPWGKVDDQFYDHPKLDALGKDRLAAAGLYWIAISWCNRYLTDGFVPTDRIVKLAGTSRREALRLRDVLVTARLWDEATEGIRVHGYLEEGRNKSRAQVEAERAAARERQQEHRSKSRRDTARDFRRDSVRDGRGDFVGPDPSHTKSRPESPNSLHRGSPLSQPGARRENAHEPPDVQALRARGWPRVTEAQRRVLYEIADRHDVAGREWAADVIRRTPPDEDPLQAVMAADREWQRQQTTNRRDLAVSKPSLSTGRV